MTTDATQLVIPLWAALTTGGGILSTLVLLVVWVFANFERKVDARERHRDLESRVSAQETLLGKVAADVAYIRGRLEPKA